MNQLSWLLYIGNVADNLGPFFFIFGVLFLILSAICWGYYFETRKTYYENYNYYSRDKSEECPIKPPSSLLAILTIPVCLTFFVFATMCPSKDTVYAIAASQMGEQALKTPLAGKAEQALESWLDKQIGDNKSAESKKDDSK